MPCRVSQRARTVTTAHATRACRSPSPTGDGTMTSTLHRYHDGQPAGAADPSRMNEDAADRVRASVDAVYRTDARRVLATLIRLLGDFDLAEEALHEAFMVAVEQWSRHGVPANPRAWLI